MRWSKRAYDARGLTQFPTGPHLAALTPLPRILVSSPSYDDIGQILTSMGVAFEPFRGVFEGDILFVNCGTGDTFPPDELRAFVEGGGCLYASCYADTIVARAFPDEFDFGGHDGPVTNVTADVVDPELEPFVGRRVDIAFDTVWATLDSSRGHTILSARAAGRERPIMVEVEVGAGAVFFTSFHNRAQASEKERELLQLLVLKQLGRTSKTSVAAMGRSLGLGITRR